MNYEELVKALRSASTVSTAWEKLMHDAAAAIEALQAEVKRLEQERDELIGQMPELTETADGWKWKWKPHWVSVEERLPDRYDAYAVGWRYPSGCFYWGKVIFYDGKWQVDEEIPTPDYWMPIEPPQEVQDDK